MQMHREPLGRIVRVPVGSEENHYCGTASYPLGKALNGARRQRRRSLLSRARSRPPRSTTLLQPKSSSFSQALPSLELVVTLDTSSSNADTWSPLAARSLHEQRRRLRSKLAGALYVPANVTAFAHRAPTLAQRSGAGADSLEALLPAPAARNSESSLRQLARPTKECPRL
jgi:hypothetical protein